MQRAEGSDAVIVEAYIIVDIGCGDRGEVEQATDDDGGFKPFRRDGGIAPFLLPSP